MGREAVEPEPEPELLECCVCFESVDRSAGIECDAASNSQHFACDECFAGWVRIDVESEETFPAAGGSKPCFGYRCRGSSSFSLAQIEEHLPAEEYFEYKTTAKLIDTFTQKFSPRGGPARVLADVLDAATAQESEPQAEAEVLPRVLTARVVSHPQDLAVQSEPQLFALLESVDLQPMLGMFEEHRVTLEVLTGATDAELRELLADESLGLKLSEQQALRKALLRKKAVSLDGERKELLSRAECEGMSTRDLKRKARAQGVDEDAIDDAADDGQAKLIELIVKHREVSPAKNLEQECMGMSTKELKKKARAQGIDGDAIDDAADEGQTKLIELIVEHAAGLNPEPEPELQPELQLEPPSAAYGEPPGANMMVWTVEQAAEWVAQVLELPQASGVHLLQKFQADEFDGVELAATTKKNLKNLLKKPLETDPATAAQKVLTAREALSVPEAATPVSVRWVPLLASAGPERRAALQSVLDTWHPQRWVIEELALGKGSSGAVFKSTDSHLGPVAIKFSYRDEHERQLVSAGKRDKLKGEAELMKRVAHEHVCKLHEHHVSADMQLFGMVVELLEGGNLAQHIISSQIRITDVKGKDLGSRVGEFEVIQLAFDVLAALAFMHRKGVIHRDIKPDNIMLTKVDGRMVFKLIDFSVSAVGY